MATYYEIGYPEARLLERAMREHAGAAELAALSRLECGEGEAVDCDRLRPWARELNIVLPDEADPCAT